MDGRTVEFNGQALVSGAMPLPAKVDGKYYIRVTAGGKSWASIALW